jgi:hypothetical protein
MRVSKRISISDDDVNWIKRLMKIFCSRIKKKRFSVDNERVFFRDEKKIVRME